MRAYDASEIEVLSGVEAVRRRPGMYVGDVHDGSGLHHLLWEVAANSLDEHLAGHCTSIRIDINGGYLEVEDDGRGIPVAAHPKLRDSALEIILTCLHAGATLDGHTPHVHIAESLRGVGMAAVNALCERLSVEVRRDGRVWRIACARGEVVSALTDCGPTDRSGTLVRFRPDPQVFTRIEFDLSGIRKRLRELTFLNPSLTIHFQGEAMRAPEGIEGWVRAAVSEDGAPSLILECRGVHEDVRVEVASAWGRRPGFTASFVSLAATPQGGAHVDGFWDAVRNALHRADQQTSMARLKARLGEHAAIVVHVAFYAPRFSGPTRDRLSSREARDAVREVVSAELLAQPELVAALLRRLAGRESVYTGS